MSGTSTLGGTELLTAAEVAEQLRLHPSSVRRAVRRGELVGIRVGVGPKARIRFDLRDVSEWLVRSNEH